VIRRLLFLDHPTETRFFLFLGAFGIVLAIAYWVLTYEVAGTTLLAAFGIGTGLLGIGLVRSRPRATAVAAGHRRQAVARTGEAMPPTEALREGSAPDRAGGAPPALTAADRAALDTPFDEPTGRLPSETLAPLALGLGIAFALTAVVFGPWLLVAGLLPFAWGAWTWLSSARDELDATVDDETHPIAHDEAPRSAAPSTASGASAARRR